MDIYSAERAHFAAIRPQPDQVVEFDYQVKNADAYIERGFAFSFFRDGVCIGATGVACMWPGCGQAWALFGADAGPSMLGITRFARHMLDKVIPYKRVQATAVVGFAPANRWLLALGFELEAARMKSYDWADRDHAQYARVRQ